MANGVIGGLGTFLRQFAAIRDEQARLAEQKRRYEEQKTEEQRRYEAEQARQERDRLMQIALSLRQFGGAVDPALAKQIEEIGLGHILEYGPNSSITFKRTPQEQMESARFTREEDALKAFNEMASGITDPTIQNVITARRAGVNLSADDLTPYDTRAQRQKDMLRFQHGLQMDEMRARANVDRTASLLAAIDQTEIRELSDLAQRFDLKDEEKKAAQQMIQQQAEAARRRVLGGQVAAAPIDDATALAIIRENYKILKKNKPNASQKVLLDQILKDIEASPDPVERMRDKRALLQFIKELNANAAK